MFNLLHESARHFSEILTEIYGKAFEVFPFYELEVTDRKIVP